MKQFISGDCGDLETFTWQYNYHLLFLFSLKTFAHAESISLV